MNNDDKYLLTYTNNNPFDATNKYIRGSKEEINEFIRSNSNHTFHSVYKHVSRVETKPIINWDE